MTTPMPNSFTNSRSTIMFGWVVIALVFGVAGIWAGLAPLSQGAVASGKVVVENQRKSVQHLEGGIVSQLNVNEGATVKAGDILIELDNTHAKANYQAAAKQFYFALAEESRLHAELEGGATIMFSEHHSLVDNPSEAEAIRKNQLALFQARKQALQGELEILEQKSIQLSELVSGLKAQKRAKQEQLSLLKEEVSDNEKLYKSKSISKVRLLELKRMVAEMEGEVATFISEIASTELQRGETELKKLQLEKQFKEKSLLEMREVQTRLADVREKMSQSEAVLERTLIRAPASGVVVNNQIVTLGEVVNPGKTLLEIVPTDQKLIIEARVQAQDIDVMQPGLEAEVRLLPFKQRLLPIVLGNITTISADVLEDERTGETYYLSQVEIPPEEMSKLGDHRLIPGMPADVIVNAGEHTVLEYLVAPLLDNFARAFKE